MDYRRNYIFFVLFILSQCTALCQQKVFTQLSVNQGLSHSDAICISQDDYSYLWIGTNSGLNKYDGYGFETYKWEPNDTKSIPGNRILRLIPTKDKIWILFENKGLYYLDLLTDTYVLVVRIPKLNREDFMFDLDQFGNIWLFEKSVGLLKIPSRSSLKSHNFKENIFLVKKEEALPDLRALVKVGEKEYFISANGDLYEYSRELDRLVYYDGIPSGIFQTATAINSTDLLISLQHGLFLWNSITKEKQRIPLVHKSKISKLNCIFKNKETYYLGTEDALYSAKLSSKGRTRLLIDSELISNIKINSIFRDKFNILWVASSGYGLFYSNLDRLPFYHIKQSDFTNDNFINNLSKNYSSAILKERGSNELWLGTNNGVFLYNLGKSKFSGQLKGLTDQHVRFIFQDSSDEIWVGTVKNGVYRFRDRKLIEHYTKSLHGNTSTSSNHIVSISEDHTGKIWLANFNSGIDIYDKSTKTFRHLFSEPFNTQSLGSDNLTYLYFDKNKRRMYVSSRDAGITVIKLIGATEFRYQRINANNSLHKLSTNYVWSICSKNSDTLFLGTIGGGLNILAYSKNNDYQVEYITQNMGLADNDVESVQLDSLNRVWMGGRGLSVYNPKTKKITNYDVHDGLQSNSFKIGASFYDGENDTMYFGGVNGVNFFDPDRIKLSEVSSAVSISGIEIFNKPINIGDTINNRVLVDSKITDSTLINLKAKENEFSINIAPLNFISPRNNKIRYKLVPYQKSWVENSYPNFKATYANIPAGNYTFEVQSSSKNNIWSEPSKLKIQIDKHWYNSNFAIFTYLFCFLGLLYFYHLQTTNRQKIKERLINAENEQLLNQGKLDFFTKISHEIRTPLTLIAGPLNDLIRKPKTPRNKEEILVSMSRHVNRLLNMVNKLLDFRKMELGHDVLLASPTRMNEFTYDLFIFFKEKAFSKQINYQFIRLPQETTLHIDKEKFETILINLLSNAFKFTPNNGSITMKLEIKGDKHKNTVFNDFFEPLENYLKLSIIDSGLGIPQAKKDKIFNQYYQIDKNSSFETIGNGIGLALVKSICNLHRIKIDVESKQKKGSTFSLRIPLGKKYLANDEIAEEVPYTKPNSPLVLHQTPLIEFNQKAIDLINRTISANRKILIVEDNSEIRLYLNQHLKEFFKVLNAENGAMGFEIAMKERPDLIISDVMMPEMNGMEFSKLIKTNDELHHIPIILLTALTSTSHELEGLKLGIEDYIRKPFDIEILLAKIFAILENRKFISEYYSKQLYFKPKSMDSMTDDEIFLQKLIKFISDNITNDELNVNFISSYMAMGKTSLYIKIKEVTGRSIIEFIRDIRLKKAGNLLLATSQTIEQISYQVGISDLKYFRKHFKATYGQNPSQYRKNKI